MYHRTITGHTADAHRMIPRTSETKKQTRGQTQRHPPKPRATYDKAGEHTSTPVPRHPNDDAIQRKHTRRETTRHGKRPEVHKTQIEHEGAALETRRRQADCRHMQPRTREFSRPAAAAHRDPQYAHDTYKRAGVVNTQTWGHKESTKTETPTRARMTVH